MDPDTKPAGEPEQDWGGHPPRLYHDLADWWPVLSTPADYAEEVAFFLTVLPHRGAGDPPTMLELGSGGGNNASHLKHHYAMTLTDRAPGMVAVSRRLNPECEHIVGDMRTLRLERTFDVVFIHDAIMYLTTEPDLQAACATAALHCRPGGALLIAPDCTRESFRESSTNGGHDQGNRALRYIAWNYDPDPSDTTFTADFAYLVREGPRVRPLFDRHIMGLFERATWLRLLRAVEFDVRTVIDPHDRELFVGRRL